MNQWLGAERPAAARCARLAKISFTPSAARCARLASLPSRSDTHTAHRLAAGIAVPRTLRNGWQAVALAASRVDTVREVR